MNKTDYKQNTVGNNVNKTSITILIILIVNLSTYPVISNSQVEMDNDSFTSLQSINHINIDDSNMDLTWLHDQGYNGSSVIIGIIDNGIDFLHEAFSNVNYTEKSFDTPEQQSTQTHGTPVSGIIVGYKEGNVNGSAPGSTIVSAEMGSNPEDTQLFGNFTAAMEWFVEQNVTIVNMSFGGIEDWSGMIEIAKENDIIIVGSAGNDGADYPPSGPGADLYSIGVGAVNELDQVAYYSSKGPTYNYFQKPDVVSQGTVESINVISGTGTYTGTSFSTPIITGGIASVISGLNQLSIPWTVGGVKAALINSSTPVTGNYQSQGAGQVNFTKMFLELSSGNPSGNIIGAAIIDEFRQVPIGLIETLPVQVVGSGSMIVSFTGNISSIFELNPIVTQTALPITINTEFVAPGNYTGTIILTVDGQQTDEREISIFVKGNFRGRVGFDYYHTDLYITGQETLLNTNPLAEQLRANGYWPTYVMQEYSEEILSDLSLLVLKNPFDYDSTNENEVFLANEIELLINYTKNGGHIIYAFDSPEIIDLGNDVTKNIGMEISKASALFDIFGITIDGDLGYTIYQKTVKIANETSVAKQTTTIPHRGLDLIGGTQVHQNFNGIIINDTFPGRILIASSTQFMDNTEYTMDLINWLTSDVFYRLDRVEVSPDSVDISYFGGGTVYDTATLEYLNYSGSVILSEELDITEVISGKYSISFNTTAGLYNIMIDGYENQYLRINYEYHSDLVFDYEPPAFTAQYPDTVDEILINGTAGQTSVTIKVDYTDNYLIDKDGFNITVNDRIAQYMVNEEQKTVQFEVTYLDFTDSDILQVIFEGQDTSGNINQIIITVVLENPPPILVEITTRETSIDKYDEQEYEQNYDAYILRIKILITVLAILVVIPVAIKLSGRINR